MRYGVLLALAYALLTAPSLSAAEAEKNGFPSYWNNGRPAWDDLNRVAGPGAKARVVSWENGCQLCEAENDASLTKCYASVQEAKASGWTRGFSGFNPGVGAWCSPSRSAVNGINMDVNTRTGAIILR